MSDCENTQAMKKQRTEWLKNRRRIMKPLAGMMPYCEIENRMEEIRQKCESVRWIEWGMPEYDELLDDFGGDMESMMEYRDAHDTVFNKADRVLTAIYSRDWVFTSDDDYDPEKDFDSCLVALLQKYHEDCGCRGMVFEYDEEEEEYYGYSSERTEKYATEKAVERLARVTKPKMINAIQKTLAIFLAALEVERMAGNLERDYGFMLGLKQAEREMINAVNYAYIRAEEASDGFKRPWCAEVQYLDGLLEHVDQRMWVE